MASLIIATLIILAGMYSRLNQNRVLKDGLSIMAEMCVLILGMSLLNLLISKQPVVLENYIVEIEEFSGVKVITIFIIVNYFNIQREQKDLEQKSN